MMTFDEAFNNIKRGKMIPFKKESLSKIQEAIELVKMYKEKDKQKEENK